jgi:transposase InsO family protein
LIADIAHANQTWGDGRIAAELLLKLGLSVSPRTVRRYMQRPAPPRPRSSSQTWRTLIENHARETLACGFFVALTATFRLVYVFLVMEFGSRRIVHWNVTEHPTGERTVQQFRGFLTGEDPYRFVVHDRDSVFSPAVDDALTAMNLHVLRTPARVPQANAFCERLIGTARRECLDHLIPLHERHLRKILAEGCLMTIGDARRPCRAKQQSSEQHRGAEQYRGSPTEGYPWKHVVLLQLNPVDVTAIFGFAGAGPAASVLAAKLRDQGVANYWKY